jgi:hypothetical protein
MVSNVQKMLNTMFERVKKEKEKEKKEDLTVPSGPAAQLTDEELSDALDMEGNGRVYDTLVGAVLSASLLHTLAIMVGPVLRLSK